MSIILERRLVAAPSTPHWGTLPVVLTGTFMTTLDFFIVNVAIPSLQRDLNATAAGIQFVVAAFGLALGSGLITAGRLGDLYGRRRMFSFGLALFTLASVACGLSPIEGVLIGARAVQGLAAALIGPQVLAILGVTYTGEQRARAFTAYGVTLGLAAVSGQLIGGLLIQADPAGLGWRSVFLINLPIGLATLALTPSFVPELPGQRRAKLDLPGIVLVEAALVALVLPLIEGRQQGWPMWAWLCLAASAPLSLAFVLHERQLGRRGGSPLVDLGLFRERSFTYGLLAQLSMFVGQASFYFVLAVYLQAGRGLDAIHAGIIFTPLGIGYMATSLLASRFGRRGLSAGPVLMALGLIALRATVSGLSNGGDVGLLTPALLLDGAGLGLVLSPLVATVLARVRPEHAGAASGVMATTMQIGNAIGVAIIGVIFFGVLSSDSYPDAFAAALVYLTATALALAALVQLLAARTK